MKRYSKLVAVLILLVFAAAASESAMAQHHGGAGHGGGWNHGGGWGHGGGVRFGFNFGIPLFWPGYFPGSYYPYPAYAYPPGVTGYASPPVYAEQGYAQSAPAPVQAQDWYFCAGSNGYYPYVQECPGGWQRVPSQPPR